MKKYLIAFALAVGVISGTFADSCTPTSVKYSCAAGFYLSGNECVACPQNGTGPDKNTGGITSCYVKSGSTGNDSTGDYTYTGNCYWTE